MLDAILKGLLWIIGTAAFLFAAAAFLLAPGRAKKNAREPFYGRNFAHRGLHMQDQSIPENSLPAFKAAVEMGYGIELDVHITKDDKLVVFHDDDLARACGIRGHIEDMTWEDLSILRLFKTENKIPLLSEVLALVSGREPIIVELKRGRRNKELCEKTYELLKGYNGLYCVESFDPRIVSWFRKNAPGVLRGQLAQHPGKMAGGTNKLSAFLVGNLLTNFMARPHFIAYGIGKKPRSVRLCESLGAMRFAWTSHGPENEKDNDAVIFEYYLPRVKFK